MLTLLVEKEKKKKENNSINIYCLNRRGLTFTTVYGLERIVHPNGSRTEAAQVCFVPVAGVQSTRHFIWGL